MQMERGRWEIETLVKKDSDRNLNFMLILQAWIFKTVKYFPKILELYQKIIPRKIIIAIKFNMNVEKKNKYLAKIPSSLLLKFSFTNLRP